ncbi:hypothetical protein ABZ297_08430 [Nonomuraea sp. NPDC005983]|uniref:hypothetical protein n=1 Tax=Nonomuraea sp. NPDC005983 TaxID=3155595 RepID=UPI0033A555A0
MVVVLRMTVAVMDVVHVVVVWHCDMAAIRPMAMIMVCVGAVAMRSAVVGVVIVQAVQVSVVDVVHVALMWHGHVPARRAMLVLLVAVDLWVGGSCHGCCPPSGHQASATCSFVSHGVVDVPG